MRKRLLSSLLALCMVLSLLPVPALAAYYSDTQGHWGASAIDRWSDYGVMQGYGDGTFNPDKDMTRAEAAQAFVQLMKLTKAADISGFTDVSANDWYADAIAKCYAAGIMAGTGTVEVPAMSPEIGITREQLFTMLARALGVQPEATAKTSFTDSSSISDWAEGYINALVNMNVLQGMGDGSLVPLNNINRASVMSAMDRAIGQYITADGTYPAPASGIILIVGGDHVAVTGNIEGKYITISDAGAEIDLSGATGASKITVTGQASNVTITGAAKGNTVYAPKGSNTTVNGILADGDSGYTVHETKSSMSSDSSSESGTAETNPGTPSGDPGGSNPNPASYTIYFNANGGTVSTSSRNVVSGSAIGTLPEPEWEGHTFLGWYTDASGGTQITSSTIVDRTITVYAHWSTTESGSGGSNPNPASYTIYFNANGGTVSTSSRNVVSGSAIGTLPEPEWEGHTFLGWYTDASGGTQITSSTIVDRTMTVYAHWSTTEIGSGRYQVTFNTYDGIYQIQRVDDGEKVSKPVDPTRELFGFAGWYLEAAATTEYDFETPVVSDLTLYAGWGNPNRTEDSEDDLYFASNETETIFSITDIIVDDGGNDVTVTYNTNEMALVAVEFFTDEMTDGGWTEENLEANFALEPVATVSGYTERYGELVNLTLPINGDLPGNYLVRASMYNLDAFNSEEPLATYITARYTKTYATFDAQTVDSFIKEGKEVINFDEHEDTNFGVLKSDIIVIPIASQSDIDGNKFSVKDLGEDEESINSVLYDTSVLDGTIDEEYDPEMEDLVPEHLFTFPDKTALMSDGRTLGDLAVGDIVYIEGTTWMFKIGTIDANDPGGAISFTQDKDVSMTDFYDVLKVDYEGVEADPRLRWEIIDVDTNASIGIGPFSVQGTVNGVELSGSISGKVTGKVSMSYDAHLFSADYFEASVSFSTEITGQVKAEVSSNNNNEYKNVVFQVDTRKVRLPTPVTGLDIYIKPAAQVNWKLSGDVSLTWTSKQTSGFKYNSDTGRTDIAKKENSVSLMAKGKAEVKIGPIIDIGIELLGGVLSGGVVAEAGAKFTAEATVHVDDDLTNTVDSKHACVLCVSGEAKWYAKATAKIGYKITSNFKGTIVQATILNFETPIYFIPNVPAKFFVSVINDLDSPFGGRIKFGGGDCTNKTYRTEFKTQGQNGQDINNIQVSVVKQGQTTSKTGVSPYVVYLYNGTYTASANMNGASVSKTVAVSGGRQTVVLSLSTSDTMLEGTVVDASNSSVISGAYVKVSKGSVVVASATTDVSGRFSIAVPEGSLTVAVSKENYAPFSSTETVYEGESTHSMGRIELNPGTGMGGFHGVIRDATTNQPIEGVTLRLYEGWNNAGTPSEAKWTLTTDADGRFRYSTTTLFGSVIGLPTGNYTLTASKEGYTDTSYNIVIYPGTTDENPEIIETMSSEMSDGYYRIVLTWGVDPRDLDSHLVADTDLGGNIHVFYSSMNPAPCYANLDRDDVDSYGPETITITNFDGLRNIRYAVHDYTNRSQTASTALASSGAVVRLYKGNQLLRTFNVPTGYGGTEWDVFTLDSTGRITTINTMTYATNPGNVLSGMSTMSAPDDTNFLKDYELAEAAESATEPEEPGVEDAIEPVETNNEDSDAVASAVEEPVMDESMSGEPDIDKSIEVNDFDFGDTAA